jgi:hypothetical protein
VRAGLGGLVERGFAVGFVIDEEGFGPEGPDGVGRGGAEDGGGDAEPIFPSFNLCKGVLS